MVRRSRDLDNADVIVPRLEFHEGFHVFDWDTVAVAVLGGGGIGCGGLVGFEGGKAAELDGNGAVGGGGGRRGEVWAVEGCDLREKLRCG